MRKYTSFAYSTDSGHWNAKIQEFTDAGRVEIWSCEHFHYTQRIALSCAEHFLATLQDQVRQPLWYMLTAPQWVGPEVAEADRIDAGNVLAFVAHRFEDGQIP